MSAAISGAIRSNPEGASHYKINQQTAGRFCSEAQQALAEGRLPEASIASVQAILAWPGCFRAYQLLGKYFDLSEQPEEATFCYRGGLPDSVCQAYFPAQMPAEATIDVITDVKRVHLCTPDSNSVRRLCVQAPEKNRFPLPTTSKPPQPNSVFCRNQATTSESCFVDIIDRGVVWHDAQNTMVFDRHGKVVCDHTVGCQSVINTLRAGCSPKFVGRRAILLGARGAHNFYHWSVDIVPKLGLLQAAGMEFSANDVFVVPFARSAFVFDLLSVFGVEREQVFEAEETSPYVMADELIVPRLKNRMGLSMGGWLPRFMRQSLLGEYRPAATLKLFISRQANATNGRVIENQSEIEAFFSARGFSIVYPERHSVVDQARLFATAAIVAGVHGAGFTNLLYCAPRTKVIEFYGAHIAPCFWAISALAGLDYYNVDCTQSGAGNKQQGNTVEAIRTRTSRQSAGVYVSVEMATEVLTLAQASD